MTTDQEEPPCSCSPANQLLQYEIKEFYKNLPAGEVASGLSVGVINGLDSSGNPIITKCYSGYANVEQGTLIDEDTVFEIGSTTKTFTTTMLANAALNAGTISLTETAQYYYDQSETSVTLPVYTDPGTGDTYPILIQDLADYTSGIPDKDPTNKADPYEYCLTLMYDYLNGLGSLCAQPGTKFKYVNTNFGIIADLLMRINSFSTYADALSSLISGAGLQMPNTGVIDSNTPSIPNLAQGYQFNGDIETNYALSTWPALLGAGGIYSTLDDMLEWLQFNMGLTGSSCYLALLPTLQQIWFPSGKESGEGLGWFVQNLKLHVPPFKGIDMTLIDKDGGTYGFHSWIGFLPGARMGTVILCNSALSGQNKINKHGSPVDNLGKAILQALLDNAT